ncbi:MAG: DinB family protein [Chloroflexi bacterium]|nr:DinB family protein [Chloroflexota bacterium]
MAHPLVEQLRFTRGEFLRCLDGLSQQDACARHGQMNCISWTIGHLADHENRIFVFLGQGKVIQPELRKICSYGSPPSTPKLDDMWAAWREVTAKADIFLDTLTTDKLGEHLQWKGEALDESIGTMLQRVIYHYWYHLGEAHAARQMLGQRNLPEFVGDMDDLPYRPH